MARTLQPRTPVKFKRGPALVPSDRLVASLDALAAGDGDSPQVRLPVVVKLDPTGLGVAGARLGALSIALDDSRLGLSLADRLGQACPGADQCAIWLEGYWRSPAVLDIRHVGEAIADLAAADHCEVEDR